MSNIGILGSGRVSTALANKLVAIDHTVTIGTRNSVEAKPKWKGADVTFADPAETARTASVIINGTPGDTSLERLSALKSELEGKILIDLSNATQRDANGLPGALCYPTSSLAEHLQQALPDTHVVKTLNTMLFTVMVDPQSLSTPPTAFLSGNNMERPTLYDRGSVVWLGYRQSDCTTQKAVPQARSLYPISSVNRLDFRLG